ncbi:MAG: hypothetical protein K6F15_08735 [Treponema sp.]|nr:hypothetical protein [Treponema sp.]
MALKYKKVILLPLILLASCLITAAEESFSVKFLGISSTDADKNMLNMTEDFYYKQISEYTMNLTYSKNEDFQTNFTEDSNLFFDGYDGDYIFYVVIKKTDDSKWKCIYKLRNQKDGSIKTISKEYESYYKILMESKTSIKNTFSELFNASSASSALAKTEKKAQVTTDAIAGTWQSNEAINKIVIMRGGRGFIIFKNGATMNIKIEISENENSAIHITQSSGNNASFYPELERKIAMEYAITAEPLKWQLSLAENGSLSGFKTSPFYENGIITQKKTDVLWKKLN